jgi:hypothetical protein
MTNQMLAKAYLKKATDRLDVLEIRGKRFKSGPEGRTMDRGNGKETDPSSQ